MPEVRADYASDNKRSQRQGSDRAGVCAVHEGYDGVRVSGAAAVNQSQDTFCAPRVARRDFAGDNIAEARTDD